MALLGPILVLVIAWAAAGIEAGPHRDPAVAAGLLDLGNVSWILWPLPAVTLVVATTLAARSGPLLPAWMTTSGLPSVF